MLQTLSEDIRECLRRAEECKRLSKTALSASAIQSYLEMEQVAQSGGAALALKMRPTAAPSANTSKSSSFQ